MTDADGRDPLVLTLAFDPATASLAQRLRDEHFPPALNRVPAHVTLFHHLPGDALEAVRRTLADVCGQRAAPPIILNGVRFLGKGVALTIDSDELLRLRSELAGLWADWLTPQDRQKFRPHVTVQNKVLSEVARGLFADLQATWQPVVGHGQSLRLWHYRGGPWEAAGRFDFGGGPG